MKILVTGGAGFIGSNLVERLVHDGHDVVVIDNFLLGRRENIGSVMNKITFIHGDIRNESHVEAAVKGCDMIFNEAAASSSPMFMKDLRDAVSVNVDGFINILNAARRFDVKKIIYASTSSIYGNLEPPLREDMKVSPPNFYSVTKHFNEEAAAVFTSEYCIETTGFRYMSVYGPHEEGKGIYANMVSQFLWDMKRGRNPVVFGDGSQARDFVFVDDVVEANVLAMDANGKSDIFNVGSGKSTSLNILIDVINKIIGKDIRPSYTEMPVKNYIFTQLADITKTREVLGYEPRYSLEQGIRKMLSS